MCSLTFASNAYAVDSGFLKEEQEMMSDVRGCI